MAIKKSEIYSALWASCDELRGGMDATQYKDYVLFMLFIKYISDKYADSDIFMPPVVIPKGASFADMLNLRGKPDIGDRINKEIIQPLIDSNPNLARSDFPDFNDPNKLGADKEMVERLGNLINIFANKNLDFSKNRAEDDDILGDAYEYLMRHFATESGKSKGQFYTPAEVSRVIAKVIGITAENSVAKTTVYDPTCGSGSLLLKVAAEAGKQITLEGQEKDTTTAGLARMNMILHDFPTATICSGNTLSTPKFKEGDGLRRYDYVVANPPFSDKKWITGLNPDEDPYKRFAWGTPPAKQGDYAYLLHIIRSMKSSTGKGACILPHGVLFRGSAEAVIRKELILSGYLKAIIGLPANLFYGTGIPACILVLDKENAQGRKGIYMMDASKGFIKDGNKNRLRERDIHQIVDAFKGTKDIAGYARMVPFDEISDPKNDYNLNLPRYIDSAEKEDLHNIEAHLRGGIPNVDIEALQDYWDIMPKLQASLFTPSERAGVSDLALPVEDMQQAILQHEEFSAFRKQTSECFELWCKSAESTLLSFHKGEHPKGLIAELAEDLLAKCKGLPLVDVYGLYQNLMDYWQDSMQDDAYTLSCDGWHANTEDIYKKDKKGKEKYTGWVCDLIPKSYIVNQYFNEENVALVELNIKLEAVTSELEALEEEHGGEDGAFSELEKITAANIKRRLKEIGKDKDYADERRVLEKWLVLDADQAFIKKQIKNDTASLDAMAKAKYPTLTEEDVQTLLLDDKLIPTFKEWLDAELDAVTHRLTTRIGELATRYAQPLPVLEQEVECLTLRVSEHLKAMGVSWQ